MWPRLARVLRVWLAAASLSLGVAFSCSGRQNESPPEDRGAVAFEELQLPPLRIPSSLPPPPLTALKLSDLPAEGRFVFPEGTIPIGQRGHASVFEIAASVDAVREFYEKRGYRTESHSEGITVYPNEGDGLLQVVKGRNRKLMLIAIPRSVIPEPH